MKKIWYLILSSLMCYFGDVQAQHQWSTIGENVETIEAGENHYYVIQEGDNTNTEGGTAGWSTSGYISNNKGAISDVKHECVFNFIDTGDTIEGFPVYILKNVANGKYLLYSNVYTAIPGKALRFTARKGEFRNESEMTQDTPWIEYSNAISDTRSVYAEGSWVFCLAKTEAREYLSFWGTNEPNINYYIDTNNWWVYEVKEDKLGAFDKFINVYTEYFTNTVTEALYPVGDNPGCISQEYFDYLVDLRNRASDLSGNPDARDEVYDKIREEIVNVFEKELEEKTVKVTEDYYLIKNVRGGFVLDNGTRTLGDQYSDTKLTYPVEEWTVDNAKYIWKFEKATEDGRFKFKNFSSEKYVGPASNYMMVDSTETSFSFPRVKGDIFLIHDGGSQVNVMTNGCWTNYNDANDPGNHFKFYRVKRHIIDSLQGLVEQNGMKQTLQDLVAKAELQFKIYRYKNGFVEDHYYNYPADSGLVTKIMQANSWSTVEGSMTAPFDGNMDTYFHTSWSDNDVKEQGTKEGDEHWIKLDLGHEVSRLIIKFTKRDVYNGHISKYSLYTPEDNNPQSEEWNKLVATSEDSISFDYGKNMTHVARYAFDTPVRYIRFSVNQTRGLDKSKYNSMCAGTGPLWHFSEFRAYDEDECVPNPKYTSIPENIRTTFETALAKAKEEVAENKATHSTCVTLEKALENLISSYPDISTLNNALHQAERRVENAVEGEKMGHFRTGAMTALTSVIESIKASINGSEANGIVISSAEIDKMHSKLKEAIKNFDSQLICPKANKIYRLVCRTGFNADNSEKSQNESCVAALNADYVNGTPVFRYKLSTGVTDRFNTLWIVEKGERGYAFKNVSNGLYMNNAYDGLTEDQIEKLQRNTNQLGWSKTPKYFGLEAFAGDGAAEASTGCFIATLTDDKSMNFQANGKVMVEYYNRFDPNAAFTFEEVTNKNQQYNSVHYLDAEVGKIQIVTLPYAYDEMYVVNEQVYEVLGLKGNRLILQANNGPVEAGTPIIVETASDENLIEITLPSENVDDLYNMEYEYEPINKNGLISAPIALSFKAGDNFGFLYNNILVNMEGGERIAAGSGYFDTTIPATEEEGDYYIEVQGNFNSESTGVSSNIIKKNVTGDVYSISGIKLRSKVKVANDTKNLPSGIYIVNGNKVVVK